MANEEVLQTPLAQGRALARDAAWSMVGVAGGPIFGMVVAVVALRLADAAAYGIYSLAMSYIIAGATVGGMGTQQRVIPWLGGRRPSREKVQRLAALQTGLVATGSVAGLAVFALLASGRMLGHSPTFPMAMGWLLVSGTAAQSVLAFGRETRRGLGRIRSATLLSPASASALSAIVLLVLFSMGATLTGIQLTMIGVGSVCLLATAAYLPTIRGTRVWRQPSTVIGEIKHWIRPSLPYGVNSFVAIIDSSIGLWLVGALAADAAAVGTLALSLRLALVFSLPITTANFATGRHLAHHTGDRADGIGLAKVMQGPLRLVVAVTALGLIGAALVGRTIVDALFGSEVSGVLPLAIILGIGYLAGALCGPAQTVLLYTGRERLALTSALIAVFIAGVAGFVGYRSHGVTGVAVATALSWTVKAILDTIFMHRDRGWSFLSALFRVPG